MIRTGMKKEDIDKDDILMTTFHSFKDIWWIVCEVDGQAAVAIMTDGVVNDILRFKTWDEAHKKFFQLEQEEI